MCSVSSEDCQFFFWVIRIGCYDHYFTIELVQILDRRLQKTWRMRMSCSNNGEINWSFTNCYPSFSSHRRKTGRDCRDTSFRACGYYPPGFAARLLVLTGLKKSFLSVIIRLALEEGWSLQAVRLVEESPGSIRQGVRCKPERVTAS